MKYPSHRTDFTLPACTVEPRARASRPLVIEPLNERKAAYAAHMARLARESVREALADIATIRRQEERRFVRRSEKWRK